MSASKGLLYGKLVRNEETLESRVLVAGTPKSDVPDWAKGQVSDEDFGAVDQVPSTEAPADAGYAGMKPEDLQALADERKLEVSGSGANGNVKKGDLVAALEADDTDKAAAQS